MRCGGDVVIALEAFERQGEVRATLRGRERVDLVDDHPAHRAQRVACPRREHEIERLGRGDEDVGRRAQQRGAFLALGVAGAHAHDRYVARHAEPFGRQLHASKRRAQVLVDVDGERAQRGHVEHPAAFEFGWHRLDGEPVDRGEECRERLARAGRRHDQRVVAAGDDRPAFGLGRRELGERGGEPRARWR